MNVPQTVLVVAEDIQLATTLVSWLSDSGCRLAVTASYRAGKDHLDTKPALLISQVRLGAYNGLQLALRARAQGIPAVVCGDANSCTKRDAEELGADYMDASNLPKERLLRLVQTAVTPSPAASHPSSAEQASCENAETARDIDTSGEN
jgi:DNA-binding NtrC family response regulator